MLGEVKKNMLLMNDKIRNLSRKIKNIKKKPFGNFRTEYTI